MDQAAEQLREVLATGRPVAALTGAGVSAESGLPTFRGAGGLWQGFRPEELATPQAFAQDPGRVWEWYHWRRRLVLQAQPNAAHRALAFLERVHPPFTLLTQNVDGLHRRAGSTRVVELHGTLHAARCTRCGRRHPLPAGAEGIVGCPACGGRARPDVVWFGESLPPQAWREAEAAASGAACLLVVGTHATVYPAAGLIELAKARGACVIEINPAETALSSLADHVLREKAGIALPGLLRAAGVDPPASLPQA